MLDPLVIEILSPSIFTSGGKVSSSMVIGACDEKGVGSFDFALRGVRANAMLESTWRPEDRAEH